VLGVGCCLALSLAMFTTRCKDLQTVRGVLVNGLIAECFDLRNGCSKGGGLVKSSVRPSLVCQMPLGLHCKRGRHFIKRKARTEGPG